MKKNSIFSLISTTLIFIILLQSKPGNTTEAFAYRGTAFIPPTNYTTSWVDSVLNSLTLDQKIAQLLMIEVRTDQNQRYYDRIGKLLTDYNIGGVAFFRGGPVRQAKLTNQWQRQMQTPFMVAMDAEWGLSMRLDSTISFPRQMTLGAITNERLIYELGMELGWQCRRMGIHINFSPVVDVNSNAENPVINSRSFGECRYNVARKGIAMMVGMHDAGIVANAKHFPGHGDTDTDSHHALPLLKNPIEEIDSVHLFPFKHLIEQGLRSVMVGHLSVPELSAKKNVATSLSPKVVTELLQNEMGFNGLIVTDALNMKSVTNYFPSGELELRALMAGNDILLMPENVPAAIKAIRQAIENKTLDLEYLNEKVRKVLYFKQMAGLDKWRPIPINNLISDLNAPRVENLNQRLAEAAITVIKNDDGILPLRRLDTLKIAALSIGSAKENPFQSRMANYYPIAMYSLEKIHTLQQAQAMYSNLSGYNLIIVSIQNNSMLPDQNYGIPKQTIDFVNELLSRNNVVLNIFANPYSIRSFGDGINNAKSIIISYQDGKNFEEASAQVIFGALGARGRLPVTASPWFPLYTGIITPGQLRIKYRSSNDTGINQQMLNRIDSIIQDAIHSKAFPGCQVAVIKDGVMIYNRSFGYHTYENRTPVKNHDLYDVASLTKIVTTTIALMKLVDDGLINLDANLGRYLPRLENTNKANMRIREVLAHQAKLRPWIPLHLKTLKDGKPDPAIFQPTKSDEFPFKVAEKLYLRKDFRDTIFKTIADSDLLNRRRYLYSDLGFILLAEIIENLTGKTIDQYVRDEFYNPLGLSTITFNPLKFNDKERIIPTELDTLFRKQLVHGHVHDPTAALLGGVSGHAGLFSNARDIAVIMQMLLQEGSYGGIQYIKPETVKEFIRTQFAGNRNRRALGFDKPTITPSETSPAALSASPQSFGHIGFTGTFAWADPKENLVFVFLSNRVHPDASNRQISQLEVRQRVHQAIYDAIYFQKFITNARCPVETTK